MSEDENPAPTPLTQGQQSLHDRLVAATRPIPTPWSIVEDEIEDEIASGLLDSDTPTGMRWRTVRDMRTRDEHVEWPRQHMGQFVPAPHIVRAPRKRLAHQRRSRRRLWRMGPMRMQDGAVMTLALRYCAQKRGAALNRHDIKRWESHVRPTFAVASDLLAGGERGRAICVLCDVLVLEDAIEITRCGRSSRLVETEYAATGEWGASVIARIRPVLKTYDPASVRMSLGGRAYVVDSEVPFGWRPRSRIDDARACERCGAVHTVMPDGSTVPLGEYSVERQRSIRAAEHPDAMYLVEVLCTVCGERATT